MFSIYKEVTPFVIDKDYKQTNDLDFNKFITDNDIEIIEPWLKSATEKDFDGDIYLNRIYRITISDTSVKYLDNIIRFKKSSNCSIC